MKLRVADKYKIAIHVMIQNPTITTLRKRFYPLRSGYSSNPPIALTPSTSRLYSLSSSGTSETFRSSSWHSTNRLFGGGMRIEIGDWGPEEEGVSKRFEGPDGRREVGLEVGGEP